MQVAHAEPRIPLESILCTEALTQRQARQPDHVAVSNALVFLAQTMANSPEFVLQQLVETSLKLCFAHSAGISLLEEENGNKIFRWHGVAGRYEPHLWGTTPRDFSPCGTVVDRNSAQLMSKLDRHFEYFAKVEPAIEEALLVPFSVKGEVVGTLWVIAHDQQRRFDAEDMRVLTTLAAFAAAAYQVVSGMIALRSIIATIREPLLVLDGSFRVKLASRSFYETFQVTPEATEGNFLYELGNGEWNIPALRLLLEDILPKEKTLESFELSHDFASLGRRVMLLNARRLVREGNPSELILLAIEDITARKAIEDELMRSLEDTQRFAYVAAHDLRAPLSTALILLELLKEKTSERLEEEDSTLLSTATSSLERVQILMDDILAYSQLGGTRARTIVPIEDALKLALNNLEKEIEATGAQINYVLPPVLKADRSQLMLVFQNLLSNALKFRGNNVPDIQIGCSRENGKWVISVADNGQGFDPKFAEYIFKPFKRLHGPQTIGSGIGLTTCQRIVEGMKGHIWAEAAVGTGATFYFTLPV